MLGSNKNILMTLGTPFFSFAQNRIVIDKYKFMYE